MLFAIKEIINPSFPLNFSINRKNVIYPYLSTFNIKLQCTLNTHGEVGKIKTGDIYSELYKTNIFFKNVKINLDKIK